MYKRQGAGGPAGVRHPHQIPDHKTVGKKESGTGVDLSLIHIYKAAEYGKFEDVIEPAESRRVIIRTLELFQNKQVVLPAKKHGNRPV